MGSGKKFYHNATLEADFAFCREKWPVHGGQSQLHQVIADAEVKAFNAYAKWCSDQAQVDGHQHRFHRCRHREIAAKAESAV